VRERERKRERERERRRQREILKFKSHEDKNYPKE
jgi:hypothetical protein